MQSGSLSLCLIWSYIFPSMFGKNQGEQCRQEERETVKALSAQARKNYKIARPMCSVNVWSLSSPECVWQRTIPICLCIVFMFSLFSENVCVQFTIIMQPWMFHDSLLFSKFKDLVCDSCVCHILGKNKQLSGCQMPWFPSVLCYTTLWIFASILGKNPTTYPTVGCSLAGNWKSN